MTSSQYSNSFNYKFNCFFVSKYPNNLHMWLYEYNKHKSEIAWVCGTSRFYSSLVLRTDYKWVWIIYSQRETLTEKTTIQKLEMIFSVSL